MTDAIETRKHRTRLIKDPATARALFEYRDGSLYWRESRANVRAGDRAGCDSTFGYRVIYLGGVQNREHRVIFLMHHGWLPDFIDHIDGDKQNNRIENLRPCDKTENNCNRGATVRNTSGYKGVYWHKPKNRWKAQIGFRGKSKHLGYFSDPKEAHAAYCEAARELHGDFANGGEATA